MKKLLTLFIILLLAACESDLELALEEALDSSVEVIDAGIEDNSDTPNESIDDSNGVEISIPDDSENSEPDIQEELEINYPFSSDFDLSELGSIGVLSTFLDGQYLPFLSGVEYQLFNRHDLFKEVSFDTEIIFYQSGFTYFFPPTNWGFNELNPGEILVKKTENKTVIMALFPDYEDALKIIATLDFRILSISNDSTLSEFFDWQSNNPLVTNDNNGLVGNTIPDQFDPVNFSRLRELDYCKVEQTLTFQNDPPQSKGFPLGYSVIDQFGDIDIAVVPIDFSNVKGPEFLIEQYAKELPLVEEWSQFITSGLMNYKIHFANQWVRAPKPAEWYGCPSCMRVIRGDYSQEVANRLQDETSAINQLFQAADDLIDWSEMEFVYFIFPPVAEIDPYYVMVYSHGGNYFTQNAGRFDIPVYGKGMAFPDPTFTDYTHWDFLIHEALHEQGLMGHGPYNGSDFSIMQNQHGYSKMVLSWEAFLLGWWDEKQISCIGFEDLTEPFEFELDSLDVNGFAGNGKNSLIVRIDENEVVVIEYRTSGLMSDLPEAMHGITAYQIQVDTPQYRCDDCNDPIEVYESKNFWRYLRDPSQEQPCLNDRYHPVYGNLDSRFCNQPRFTLKAGSVVETERLKIRILTDNRVELTQKN